MESHACCIGSVNIEVLNSSCGCAGVAVQCYRIGAQLEKDMVICQNKKEIQSSVKYAGFQQRYEGSLSISETVDDGFVSS
ncbi:hypothetical protein TNCV_354901 [Trichonephila clavipes]|uniref:Uncharacterized protein n=1 Tax=Trichonephila clavipes TaxID=2585209 RepID=A0A8X6W192_TRICX|nr:hypothetical protein TNCV_354901 [Trichonephila clavipes]